MFIPERRQVECGGVFVYTEDVYIYGLKQYPNMVSIMQGRTKVHMNVYVSCHVQWNSNMYKMPCLFHLENPFQPSSI